MRVSVPLVVAVSVCGLASRVDAQPETESSLQPMEAHVQVGLTLPLRMSDSVRRVVVADPSVASARIATESVIDIRGLRPGRTLVVAWTTTARTLLVLYVDAEPISRIEPGRRWHQDAPTDPGTSLHFYRVTAYGTKSGGHGLQYAGQRHLVSSVTQLPDAVAVAAAAVSARPDEPTTLESLHARYETPRLVAEVGDLGLASLTVLGTLPPTRGAMIGYHDPKYQLVFFGGPLRRWAESSFWGVDDTLAGGAQLQFSATDTLSMSLQATGSQPRPYLGEHEAGMTVSPAVHWQPWLSLGLHGEGAVNERASAGRLRLAYTAPLLNVQGVYQSLGSGFTYPQALSMQFGQVSALLTPSRYYNVYAVAGRTAAGAPLFARTAPSRTAFVGASTTVQPGGVLGISHLGLRHHRNTLEYEPSIYIRTTRATDTETDLFLHRRLADRLGHLTLTGRHTTQRFVSPGAALPVDARQSWGTQAEVGVDLSEQRWTMTTTAAYDRRLRRTDTETASNVYSVGAGVTARRETLLASLSGFASRDEPVGSATPSATTLWGRFMAAYRPTEAHEVRCDVDIYRLEQGSVVGASAIGGAQPALAGSLTYTYYFGSAISAPSAFDFWGSASIEAIVFVDANENGVRDRDEPPIEGAIISLDGETRATSGADGRAMVSDIDPGRHELRVEAPQQKGMKYTTASRRELLLGRAARERVQIGLSDRSRIFGLVYNDLNLNGEHEQHEPGLSSVRVALRGADGQEVATAQSETGSFELTGLPPGKYVVELDPRGLPAGYALNGHHRGNGNGNGNGHGNGNGNGNGHGGASSEPARRLPVELESGALGVVSFPVRAIRTVGGVVFVDADGDGKLTARDTPAANVKLQIGDQVVTTNAEGRYLLRYLPAGEVVVQLDTTSLPRGAATLLGPAVPLVLGVAPTAKIVDFPLRRR